MKGYSKENVPRYINRYYPSVLAQLRYRDYFFDDTGDRGIEYMGNGKSSVEEELNVIDCVHVFYRNGQIKWKYSVPEFLELLKRCAEDTKRCYPQDFEKWNSSYPEVERRLLSRWSGSPK